MKPAAPRKRTARAWLSDDPVEQSFAIAIGVKWRFNLLDYDAYVESIDSKPARAERIGWRFQALQAYQDGNSSALEGWLTAMRLALLWAAREDYSIPLARIGKKFTAGRKVGAKKPLTKAIEKMVAASPKMKTAEIWAALKKKPPKGHDFYDSDSMGKYIERSKDGPVHFKRFEDLCTAARPKKAKTVD